MTDWKLVPVEPQPDYIESSGRWRWTLPEHARFEGCSTEVVTASREWWEYCPSEAKPHPMSQAVWVRDVWYWMVPAAAPDLTELRALVERLKDEAEFYSTSSPAGYLRSKIATELESLIERMEGKA